MKCEHKFEVVVTDGEPIGVYCSKCHGAWTPLYHNDVLAVKSDILTTSQVAEESGYTVEHVRDAVRSGELRAFQPGGRKGRIRIPRSEMEKWLTRPATKAVMLQ
jgi:excisionase family DNA binding protein